ncbi:MAG: DUF2911 domain-containing protein [Gemmatimonadales bacterium]|nr:DUF2911 domain-containing protein [Gemmatimonadales bacterium]
MRFVRLSLGLLMLAPPLAAQAGSFVVRLGADTLQVERFVARAADLEGIVVTRVPTTRVTRWTAKLDRAGRIVRFESTTRTPEGRPVPGAVEHLVMVWQGDSLVREVTIQGERSEQRLRVPPGTVPGPSLPYLGTSYLLWEIGFREAKATTPDSSGARLLPQVAAVVRQLAPSRTRFWTIRPDSIEADYFGAGRSGWAFDGNGQLLRADWRGTTYRYRIVRTAAVEVEAIGRAWAGLDAAGAGMGAMSPRDSVHGSIGVLRVTLDYSRPARRGRTIWGDVVPWDRVWRLGADMATQLTLSADAMIGDALVPAGSYSLWMLPVQGGPAQLVINKRAKIFGTQYNVRDDLVRVPLEREPLPASIERLTLAIEDGRLVIRWGDVEWSVVLRAAG